MDTHKNARLAPKGREEMVRSVVDRGMSKAAAARQFNTTIKDGGQMGWPLPRGGRGRLARSILKTSFIARPNPARHLRCRGKFAPPALHPGTDRRSAAHLQSQRFPHPQTTRP